MSGSALWRLRGELRPYRGGLILNALLGAASVLAGLLLPLLTRRLLDDHALRGDTAGLALTAVATVLCAAAEAALIALRVATGPASALAAEDRLRRRLARLVLSQGAAFHDRHPPSVLTTRLVTDLAVLRRFVSFGLPFLVINTLTVVVVVALLVGLSPPLGLLVVLSAMPMSLVVHRRERATRPLTLRVQRAQEEYAELLDESVQGLDTIRAYGRGAEFTRRLELSADRLRRGQRERVRAWAALTAVVDGYPSAVLVLLAGAGAAAVMAGALTVGTLVAFLTLWLFLLWPIRSISGLLDQLQQAAAAAERLTPLLDAPAPAPPTARDVSRRRGVELVLDEVWFRYGDGPGVLTGVSLLAAPGERLVVCGVGGSGKSTLTALLTGLYPAVGGRILIGGVDVRDVAGNTAIVASVPEEPGLFAGTVRDNVRLGRPGASDRELRAALSAAQVPDGPDAVLGEGGTTLSGGQRRRLALARAFLCRPGLLVLDDPLVGLDPATARQVTAAVVEEFAGSTVLWLTRHEPPLGFPARVLRLQAGRLT